MGKEITGIASEFYVLSMLLRKGADATLTLGNKKNIDIFVNKDGMAFTIDVKGLKSTGDFILGNHDLYFRNRRDVTSVEFLREFSNIHLIEEITEYKDL